MAVSAMNGQPVTMSASTTLSFAIAVWLRCSHLKLLEFSFLLICSIFHQWESITLWQGDIWFTSTQQWVLLAVGQQVFIGCYLITVLFQPTELESHRRQNETCKLSKSDGFGFWWELSLKAFSSCCFFTGEKQLSQVSLALWEQWFCQFWASSPSSSHIVFHTVTNNMNWSFQSANIGISLLLFCH